MGSLCNKRGDIAYHIDKYNCGIIPQFYSFRFMYLLEPTRERPAGTEIPIREITVINKTEPVSGPERISQNCTPSGGGVCSNVD